MTDTVDLLVVGGGVNGAGIARDAAGRGLSVVLCEKDDLGQGTSSRSGKLVHGGLRYLEYYEFRLVREALALDPVQILEIQMHQTGHGFQEHVLGIRPQIGIRPRQLCPVAPDGLVKQLFQRRN